MIFIATDTPPACNTRSKTLYYYYTSYIHLICTAYVVHHSYVIEQYTIVSYTCI